MVWQLGVAALGVLGGAGLFQAGRGANRAGRGVGRLADRAGDVVERVGNDVHRVTNFVIDRVNHSWPEVEKILNQTQAVLHRAEDFLVMSTLMVKLIMLVLSLCAVYLAYHLSKSGYDNKYGRRARNETPFQVLEHLILQTVHFLALILSFVLAANVICEVFAVTWPNTIPYIIIIPSAATVYAVLKSMNMILQCIITTSRQLVYVMIELPFNSFFAPATKGLDKYTGNATGLPHIVSMFFCLLYSALYLVVTYLSLVFFADLLEKIPRNETFKLKIAIAAYALFYLASIGMYLLGSALLVFPVRPTWSWFAKRNLEKKYQ